MSTVYSYHILHVHLQHFVLSTVSTAFCIVCCHAALTTLSQHLHLHTACIVYCVQMYQTSLSIVVVYSMLCVDMVTDPQTPPTGGGATQVSTGEQPSSLLCVTLLPGGCRGDPDGGGGGVHDVPAAEGGGCKEVLLAV